LFIEERTGKMNNVIFIVTGEKSCPYYNVGDELKVESGSLSISAFKPVCLYLSDTIKTVVTAPNNLSRFPLSFAKIDTWQICRNPSCSLCSD